MTTSNHYKSNLRDIFFNLFEMWDVGHTVLGKGPYTLMDEPTAKETMKSFEKLCVDKMSQSFVEGDRVPLKLDEQGNVHLPEGVRKSLQEFFAADWHRFDMPERLEGFGAPRSVYWSAFEMLVGANPPVAFYLFGTFAVHIIDKLGTPDQKKRFVNNILNRHWGATMVLTEPDAGSDVGSGRSKAKLVNGEWHIEGVKRFITNGDFDAAENIVHLVLARPEGAQDGTKGLSLFLVPKFWVNEDGSMGERNGVVCTSIEKKMGIKASATCELTFGEKAPARGLLLGDVHEGIRQMFKVIEQARMAVGVKSMATLSTAYLNALEFTKERTQGPDLMQAMDKHAPRVKIIAHPDVRRMLMLQKSHAEGMRALCVYTAYIQDQAYIKEAAGEDATPLWHLNDILLPLVKGYNSERVYELLSVSLQCYGGSGYVQDYPIEQYVRDQKIDSLYEGTTHIQALDLIFRKIARDGGQTLNALLNEIRQTAETKAAGDGLSVEYQALSAALSDAEAIMVAMMGKLTESFYHVGLLGNRVLCCIAELVIGWLLVKQAEVATKAVANAKAEDKFFYEGKLAAARFYCKDVLPNLTTSKTIIEHNTLELMELPQDAF